MVCSPDFRPRKVIHRPRAGWFLPPHKRLWLAMVLGLRLVSMSATAGLSPVPARFIAHIGGYFSRCHDVELDGTTLVYSATAPGTFEPKRTSITPTDAHWREFRQALDELGLWQWHAEYINNDICDGTQWSLDIAYADRALKTFGSNSYPGANGEPAGDSAQDTTFQTYLTAIQKLTGKRLR